MLAKAERLRFVVILAALVVCALLLMSRLVYLVLADPLQFPINTVKIVATYQHITRAELESVLSKHRSESFFSLCLSQLRSDLMTLPWVKTVQIERVWPDTIKVSLAERVPIAVWNDALISMDGILFSPGKMEDMPASLPRLSGPDEQKKEVLQIYEKLSKLLTGYGLTAASFKLRESQAWELSLTNGIMLRLGKRDLELRLQRFCRAYPVVFADKPDELSSVDLRYARGMAVQWKQQSGR